MGKSDSNVSELGGLANLLTHTYDQLASQTPGAIATTPSADVSCLFSLLPRCIMICVSYHCEVLVFKVALAQVHL